MKPALRHLVPLIVCLAISPSLPAESVPALPPSSRVLTIREVQNYWINTLQGKAIPTRPLGLHPDRQRAWDEAYQNRLQLIRAIRGGQCDTEARLAMLSHNAIAWRRLGNEPEAVAAETQLYRLQEHLSKMRTLEMQREAARAQIDAANKIRDLEAEISALRADSWNHGH